MRLGVCCSPADAATLPAGAVDFIEANVQSFLVPFEDESAFTPKADFAAASPIPILSANCFLPASLKSTGPDLDPDRIEAYAASAFTRAARIGMKIIVFGSGGSRQIPVGFPPEKAREQFLHLLARLGPLAAAHNVTLVVEPLNRADCNFIHTVAEGAALIHEVNHPHIRLLADFFHMLRNEEDPGTLRAAAPVIAHTHVAEKANRTPPGTDGDDFRPFLTPLREAGYPGALALECNFPNGLAADCPRALASLRAQGA
jgi:sugar phosphate isomerase/epimerase